MIYLANEDKSKRCTIYLVHNGKRFRSRLLLITEVNRRFRLVHSTV